MINEDGIEISNYDSDGNSELPIINSKGKIAAIFIENSSKIKISNVEITADGGGANKYLHTCADTIKYSPGHDDDDDDDDWLLVDWLIDDSVVCT